MTTGDGRVDVTVPAQMGGLANADGQWSRLAFSTDGAVAAPPDGFGHLDFEAIESTDRAVVRLSGNSAAGGLEIASLTPRSTALRNIINPDCVHGGQPFIQEGSAGAGQVTDVNRLSWQSIKTLSTSPDD